MTHWSNLLVKLNIRCLCSPIFDCVIRLAKISLSDNLSMFVTIFGRWLLNSYHLLIQTTLEAIKRQLRMRRLRKDKKKKKKIPEGLSSFCGNREYMFWYDRSLKPAEQVLRCKKSITFTFAGLSRAQGLRE